MLYPPFTVGLKMTPGAQPEIFQGRKGLVEGCGPVTAIDLMRKMLLYDRIFITFFYNSFFSNKKTNKFFPTNDTFRLSN